MKPSHKILLHLLYDNLLMIVGFALLNWDLANLLYFFLLEMIVRAVITTLSLPLAHTKPQTRTLAPELHTMPLWMAISIFLGIASLMTTTYYLYLSAGSFGIADLSEYYLIGAVVTLQHGINFLYQLKRGWLRRQSRENVFWRGLSLPGLLFFGVFFVAHQSVWPFVLYKLFAELFGFAAFRMHLEAGESSDRVLSYVGLLSLSALLLIGYLLPRV